ncbi:MAG: SOS response-associated peptidase, partial [Candidatus Heimdallarchaeota archaeon]|nr:SOS response-associated peptidase [Candidatus Heimdallarchaeota archaeon]
MCGRFSRFTGIDSIQDRYDLKTIIELESNYNTSPQDEAVVILRSDINHSQNMIWGFLPFWSKTRTISNKTINARSDSLEKKYFKHSFEQK